MNRVKFLFVLFFLLQYSTNLEAQEIQNLSEDSLHSQEISFYYDKIIDSLYSQSEGDQLLENLTRQIWNESSSSWVNDSLYEHSYNNKNLVDTMIVHKWRNGNVWGNDGRWRYIYNSNNKLSKRYRDVWATTYWLEDLEIITVIRVQIRTYHVWIIIGIWIILGFFTAIIFIHGIRIIIC